jgi:uncharacterized protein
MPSRYPTVVQDLIDWIRHDHRGEIRGWYKLVYYYAALLVPALIGLVALIAWVDPLPPNKAYMGTGQPGTAQHALAQRFASILGRHGVELVLIETAGVGENLQTLDADSSPVNASFLTAGSARTGQFPNLVSLGSIQYSPVWLFYRGQASHDQDPVRQFADKRIAIGLPGTNTRNVLERLFSLAGEEITSRPNLFELPHAEAAQRLVDGDLDAVFMVDGIASPTVRKLLATPGIRIFDFNLVDAYVKHAPWLDKVVVPRASIDLRSNVPDHDTDMLASSLSLLVEKDMHPTLQWLFMMAAREIGRDRSQFFAKPGFFPAYLDQSIPLGPIAERFLERGPPVLAEYLPFWLAVLIDRIWVSLLTFFLVIVPLALKILGWRDIPSNKTMQDSFEGARMVWMKISEAHSREDCLALHAELDQIQHLIDNAWLSGDDARKGFNFSAAANRVREAIDARMAELERQTGTAWTASRCPDSPDRRR